MSLDADCVVSFRAVAEQALQSWAAVFGAPAQGPRQRELAQSLACTQQALTVLAGRGRGRFHFQATQITDRSAPDQEFAESSRCWRLEIDGTRVHLRRWTNHATLMGATQTQEIDGSGASGDPVPDALNAWMTSVQVALVDANALHQTGSADVDLMQNDASRQESPPAGHGAEAPATDWRGIGLLALLIAVAGPMKIAVVLSDSVRTAWNALRGRH